MRKGAKTVVIPAYLELDNGLLFNHQHCKDDRNEDITDLEIPFPDRIELWLEVVIKVFSSWQKSRNY